MSLSRNKSPTSRVGHFCGGVASLLAHFLKEQPEQKFSHWFGRRASARHRYQWGPRGWSAPSVTRDETLCWGDDVITRRHTLRGRGRSRGCGAVRQHFDCAPDRISSAISDSVVRSSSQRTSFIVRSVFIRAGRTEAEPKHRLASV